MKKQLDVWVLSLLIGIPMGALGVLIGQPVLLVLFFIPYLFTSLPNLIYNPYKGFAVELERTGFGRENGRWKRGSGEGVLFFEEQFIRTGYRTKTYALAFTSDFKVPEEYAPEFEDMETSLSALVKEAFSGGWTFKSKRLVELIRNTADDAAAEAARRLFELEAVRNAYLRYEDGKLAVEIEANTGWDCYHWEDSDIQKIADFFSALGRAWAKKTEQKPKSYK